MSKAPQNTIQLKFFAVDKHNKRPLKGWYNSTGVDTAEMTGFIVPESYIGIDLDFYKNDKLIEDLKDKGLDFDLENSYFQSTPQNGKHYIFKCSNFDTSKITVTSDYLGIKGFDIRPATRSVLYCDKNNNTLYKTRDGKSIEELFNIGFPEIIQEQYNILSKNKSNSNLADNSLASLCSGITKEDGTYLNKEQIDYVVSCLPNDIGNDNNSWFKVCAGLKNQTLLVDDTHISSRNHWAYQLLDKFSKNRDGYSVEVEKANFTRWKSFKLNVDNPITFATVMNMSNYDLNELNYRANKLTGSKQEYIKPIPLEILEDRKELPIFDTECLPKVIGGYVNDLANVMQQPIQYIATSSLVSIAGLLGNKVCIELNERKIYPILWGMLIGDSGTGKTPCINEPMKFIKEIDKQFIDDYKKEYANYKTTLGIYDIELKSLQNNLKNTKDNKTTSPDMFDANTKTFNVIPKDSKDSIKEEIYEFVKTKPIKPYSREICINKATKEALLSQIADDSPNGLILEIDELMDFINSITRSERIEDHQLYVEAYNNGSFKSKTISRGTQYVENVTISIIGGVQTQRLVEFMSKYNGSGFLARFQLIPIAEKQQREYKDTKVVLKIRNEYLSLLNSLKEIPQRFDVIGSEKVTAEPKKYYYTSEAKRLYKDWFNKSDKRKHEVGQSDLMIEYLGKADNTFHTLSLIYHLAVNQDSQYIPQETISKVIATLKYFYSCAEYLYGYNFNKALDFAKSIASIKNKLNNKNGFSAADITRSKSSFRNLDKGLVQEALDTLESYHYIKKANAKGTKYTKYHWL